ncbi:MAG: hypothetical protein JXQ73_08940 [Phycisphaerae bacterium]|nr:hypothetical protein [Phycisphaerae bacterium]
MASNDPQGFTWKRPLARARMLGLAVVAFGLVAPALLAQQAGGRQWLSSGKGKAGEAPGVSIRSKAAGGIELLMTCGGAYTSEFTARDGNAYAQLSAPGCGAAAEGVGQPELPFKGFFLEVPHGVDVGLQIGEIKRVSLGKGYKIHPQQPAEPEGGDAPRPAFQLDAEVYARNALCPASPIKVDPPGVIRGRRVVFVQVFPFQWNPATTELSMITSVRFSVTLAGAVDAAAEARKSRLATPEFESLASRMLLNYEPAAGAKGEPEGEGVQLAQGDGADYLIIVADDLYEEILPLAEWKHRKGFRTHIATMTEVGTTNSDVLSYIEDAYTTWDPAPSYLLLVGDSEDIPPWNHLGEYECITDHRYACMDGDADYDADMTLGRLPVATELQCTTVVDKILTYDRTPDTGDWYSSFLSAGYFQDTDDNNGYADRWFMETSAHATEFLDTTVGMTTYTAWCAGTTALPPYHYRTTDYPHRFPHPDLVPESVVNAWLAPLLARVSITLAINEGVGLVLHRNHGFETGWEHPLFNTTDINALANGVRTPVVLSLNCLTGNFAVACCFCESFLRHPYGGAVGIVGATRTSYSGWNDLLTHGMFTCFWPAYDPAHTDATYPYSWRPAAALDYGKHYMRLYKTDSSQTKGEIRMFHYFGDPEMMLRTQTPRSLNVTHPAEVPGDVPTDLTVTVVLAEGSVPVEGAHVALSSPDADLYLSGVTNANGECSFVGVVFPAAYYDVVATAHDCIPYEGMLSVAGCPSASDDSVNIPAEAPAEVTLVATDPESDPLTYTITALPSHGTLADPGGNPDPIVIDHVPYQLIGNDGVVIYTPETGHVGADSFMFEASDGTCVTPDVTLTVNSYCTLTLTVIGQEYGSVTVDPDLPIYEPGSTVTLTVEAVVGGAFSRWEGDVPAGHEHDKILTITMDACKQIQAIFAVNQCPIARNGTARMVVDGSAEITLAATDADQDDLVYIIASLPAHGTLSDPGAGAITEAGYVLVDGGDTVVYTPSPGYTGTDSFTFKADDDSCGESNEATVMVLVTSQLPMYNPIVLWGQVGSDYLTTGASAINEQGHVAGGCCWWGLLWRDGVTTELGQMISAPSLWVCAEGLNDQDQVVAWEIAMMVGGEGGESESGHACGAICTRCAFLWEEGEMTAWGYPWSVAKDINNSGKVAGFFTDFGYNIYDYVRADDSARFWDGATTHVLAVGASRAYGLNNADQVVGVTNGQAFLWQNSVMTTLGTLSGGEATAWAISDTGKIVGGSDGHAFLWEDGSMTDLGTLTGGSSVALGINEVRQVVGISDECGFLWHAGTMIDLNTRIPAGTGLNIVDARDINNAGQIAANTEWSAVLLNPGYTLKVDVSDEELGSVDVWPNWPFYPVGEDIQVTLTPAPVQYFQLDHWEGSVPEGHETDDPLVITMDADKHVTAVFSRIPCLYARPGGACTEPETPVDIPLLATDPDWNPLENTTYIIVWLSSRGSLYDPVAERQINSSMLPYTLAGAGNVVRFTPGSGYQGVNTGFGFMANTPECGDCDPAAVTVYIKPLVPYYHVLTFGDTIGGNGAQAKGINDAGQVVGWANTSGSQLPHAFLSGDGIMTDLGTLGGSESVAFDINNAGLVVGWAHNPGGVRRAFLWQDGVMTDLGALADGWSEARAINNADPVQIVGVSNNHAFLWQEGQLTDLGTLGDRSNSIAHDVNIHGQIVGESYSGYDSLRAVLWDGGTITDLGTLYMWGSGIAYASGINDAGQVVGEAYKYSSIPLYPFLWQNGVMTQLPELDSSDADYYRRGYPKINNSGLIAGAWWTGGLVLYRRPYACRNGVIEDLEDRADATLPYDPSVNAVNNLGQVALGWSMCCYACYLLNPGYTLTLNVTNGPMGTIEIVPDYAFYPIGWSNPLVRLTAYPNTDRLFDRWLIHDPEHPDDANYATQFTDNPLTLTMNEDTEITGIFKCGSAAAPLLPMVVILLGVARFVSRAGRRRRGMR